jgi:hypothetical protein
MPARKQFQSSLTTKPELKRLLEEARRREVSDEEMQAQRVSFAYGNAPADSRITKDSVESASRSLRLRR